MSDPIPFQDIWLSPRQMGQRRPDLAEAMKLVPEEFSVRVGDNGMVHFKGTIWVEGHLDLPVVLQPVVLRRFMASMIARFGQKVTILGMKYRLW